MSDPVMMNTPIHQSSSCHGLLQACAELDRQSEALATTVAAISADLAVVRAALSDMTRVNAAADRSIR